MFVYVASSLLMHWVKDWVITCSINGLAGALRKMYTLFNDGSSIIAQNNSTTAPSR